MIPEAAQVSAEIAYLEAYMKSSGDHIRATRAALEAAAPHMLAVSAGLESLLRDYSGNSEDDRVISLREIREIMDGKNAR